MRLDQAVVDRIFTGTSGEQHRYDHTQKPEKLAAKRLAAGELTSRLPGGKLLDVGGEDFYHKHLTGFEIVTHNLPDGDMHELAYTEEFDAALAMHVLEHSPFPLLVLALIWRALKPGGWLYVAVPRPCTKFCENYGHQSVMPAAMWAMQITRAGFRIEKRSSGKFGPRRRWVEDRFVCQKPVA